MRTVSHLTQHQHNAPSIFSIHTVILCLWGNLVCGLSRGGSLGWEGEGAVAPAFSENESQDWQSAQAVTSSFAQLATLQDLQIGSFQGGADAVTNGIVQNVWSSASPTVVNPLEGQLRLWAVLSNVASSGVPLAQVTIVSTQPAVATASVQLAGQDPRSRSPVIGNVLKPLVADIVFDCRRAGATGFTVVYRFSDVRLAPVELSLTKECGQRGRVGLSLGTSEEKADNVIRNGVSRWPTGTALRRIIPPSQDHIDLFWTLRASGGQDDTASQLLAAPKVNVKTLSFKLVPQGKVPAIEKRRWQRRLTNLAAREEEEKHTGLWGLESANSNRAQQIGEIARVHFTGALQDGGSLPAAAEIPTGLPPPSVRLEVECLRMGAALIEVEMSPVPAYQPYRPAVFSFVKQCGGAISHGFDVASHMLVPNFVKPNILEDGVPTGAAEGGYAGDADNVKNTFSVYWRLADRSYGPPDATSVACDGGIVASKLLPSPPPNYAAGDIVAGRQDVHLSCSKGGVSWCTLQFAWRLYSGPAVRFRKFCGGTREDVDVFSDMAGAPAVFLQGKSNKAWGLSPEVTLPADQDKTVFTIALDRTLKPGEQVLKVSSPQLRVFRPDVVEAVAGGELLQGGQVDKNIDGGSDLELLTKCKKTGESRIEVTLPIDSSEQYKPLSFAFTKQCSVVSYWQQWWVMSMLSFASIFLFCGCMLTVCAFANQKKRPEFLHEMHDVADYDEA
jgi:hypothetical protein